MLGVGQTVRIDFEMPVASQQSLVTVTTEIPMLETEKTEQSQNVSENLVSNLPVSSRRWEQFALLTPGSTPDGTTGGQLPRDQFERTTTTPWTAPTTTQL